MTSTARPPRPPRRKTTRLAALTSGAVVALSAVVVAPMGAVAATDTNPSFKLIPDDLEFILDQIQISEAHAAGGDLLCADNTDTSGKCVRDPMLPHGLRTVDGSFNNLARDPRTGAADEEFPRLLPTQWRQADPHPGNGAPPNPAGVSDVCEGDNTCYEQTNGFVYDASPRTISNLIVDQTTANPAAVDAATNTDGSIIDAVTGDIYIPDSAPDEALSAPINAWMTFFGQFFDHGLDLVDKGGNGTIVVPLQPDDPLYDITPPNQRFMMLTRATNGAGEDGVRGTADDVREHNNETTPFVDQNQTYTSHPAHQAFLREYELVDGVPVDTGRLLNGAEGGLATWDDIKRQAREVLGIELGGPESEKNDYPDVVSAPQLVVDYYGNFVPGPNGFPQLALAEGAVLEGDPTSPVSTADALRTGHAFLEDIAHGATQQPNDLSGYDNVLLGQHFVTGDGRGNENIGLTAVHHVFHSEHNRLVDHINAILDLPENADLRAAYEDQSEEDDWSYNQRVFQAARFTNEMQYQHLVFEEFARRIQPNIDAIVFNENSYDDTIDPAITAEFAHVVYRFGHSMLTQDINREGFGTVNMPLLDGFLNPVAFHCRTVPGPGNVCPAADRLTADQAAGSIVNGTTNQTAGQIDELVTSTLRNNLLGLPLDLPAINIMRGRDAGVPPLQVARKTFFEASGNTNLEPYTSWHDFGLSLKNGNNFGRGTSKASLVNFVAAYGQHPSVTAESTIIGKRAAADLLVNGARTIDMVDRHAGKDRFGTAAAVSAANFNPGVPAVYIANGMDFPDALAGGPAAKVNGAPVLLVRDGSIPAETSRELLRLDPKKIVVLGGNGVVSDGVLRTLREYTAGSVTRVAGADRYATAAAISRATFRPNVPVAYVATGANFPDALSGSAVASRDGAPVLLVTGNGIPSATATELSRLRPGRIVILGGSGVVSNAVASQLDRHTAGSVSRLAGANRYDTATAVSRTAFPQGADTVYLATGSTFPDALAAVPVAGRNAAPILLTPTANTLPAAVQAELRRLDPDRVVLLGGTGVVTTAQERAVVALFPPPVPPADRAAFMNSTGAWASTAPYETVTGLEDVDFWVGGLAEALDPFGGMLGSTFNYVFEKQLEDLQFGDRYYYLFRNQGNQLFAGLEANSFSGLIQRNTDASLVPADIFAVQDPMIDLEAVPNPRPAGLLQMPNGQWRWDGDEHIEIHGHRTAADNIRAGQGDDALFGYGGNDRIEGGSGNDGILGGPGNDILTDTFGDDNIKGEDGNDAIDSGYGFDLTLGGHGDDFIVNGHEDKTVFAGTGRDIVLGGTGRDTVFGNEGADWLEGGDHADLLMGDNAQQFQNDRKGGADVLLGQNGSDDFDAEGGDDIMVGQNGGTDRFHGMYGFDYVTYDGENGGVDADLAFNLLQPPDVTAIRDRYLDVEALSGGDGNDVLRGLGSTGDGANVPGVNLLTEEGLARISGLTELLRPADGADHAARFMSDTTDGANNLILGGAGSDVIEGRTGDNFLDGDAFLQVQLEHGGVRHDSAAGLRAAVFAGTVDPGTITIVREIATPEAQDGVEDTAVYDGVRDDYAIEDLGDGYWEISHDDGTDVIRNFELLQFEDGTWTLPDLEPVGDAGELVVDAPAELAVGQAVTARLTLDPAVVSDPTDVAITWQNSEGQEWAPTAADDNVTDAPGSLTDTFVPGEGDVGTSVRAVATFVDDEGRLRTVTSAPVGAAAVGETGVSVTDGS
jgi:putative cell wall-binding protein